MLRLLRFPDLVARGIVTNRMTLSRWIKERGFPRPVQLGPNTVAWHEDEVQQWLEARARAAGRSRQAPAPAVQGAA